MNTQMDKIIGEALRNPEIMTARGIIECELAEINAM